MIYQWRLNVYVTVKYLINIDAPVVKCKMHFKTNTSTNTNCALTECSHQKLGSLVTGANFMILEVLIRNLILGLPYLGLFPFPVFCPFPVIFTYPVKASIHKSEYFSDSNIN